MATVSPVMTSGSLLHYRQLEHELLYPRVFAELGNSGIICPLLNDQWDTGATTFTSRRAHTDGAEAIFTAATDEGSTVGDFLVPPTFEGITPVIRFTAASNEWFETPDTPNVGPTAYWNGTADGSAPNEPAYTWLMWTKVVAGGSGQTLWSKSAAQGTTGTDWIMFWGGAEKLGIRTFDDNANTFIGTLADAAFIDGQWVHVAVVKTTVAADTAFTIYVDGAVVADTDVAEAGTYVAQEDGTNVVRIGAETDGSLSFDSSLACGALGPARANTALTAANIKNIRRMQAPFLGIQV